MTQVFTRFSVVLDGICLMEVTKKYKNTRSKIDHDITTTCRFTDILVAGLVSTLDVLHKTSLHI